MSNTSNTSHVKRQPATGATPDRGRQLASTEQKWAGIARVCCRRVYTDTRASLGRRFAYTSTPHNTPVRCSFTYNKCSSVAAELQRSPAPTLIDSMVHCNSVAGAFSRSNVYVRRTATRTPHPKNTLPVQRSNTLLWHRAIGHAKYSINSQHHINQVCVCQRITA